MLKISAMILIVFFSFTGIILAQSGRRVTAAPTPMPDTRQAAEKSETGYSESAPNRAVSISSNPKREKKSKKDQETADPIEAQPVGTGETDEEVVKIESNLITIPVSVYDRSGIYIAGLDPHNFKIFEDGQEQEVAYFGTTDKPITAVLVLDMSASAAFKIDEIRSAAKSFVDLLKPEDSVIVISFDESVYVQTDVTTDRQKIYKAINKTSFGGGTALYDAVAEALGKRLDKIEGRKAVVLFTDGVDTVSYGHSFESTLRDAEEVDAMIFPIYYNTFLAVRGIGGGGVMSGPPMIGIPGTGGQVPVGARSEDYARGRAYLNELAEITGGRVFKPDSTPGGLNAAFAGIAEELSRQYVLGYYPAEIGRDGERKQLRVRVNRSNLIVRARDSYIVGANAK